MVITVAFFALPLALAGCLAGVTTTGFETIPLAIRTTRVRNKILVAMKAFASTTFSAHSAPKLPRKHPRIKYKNRPGRKSNQKKEEEFYR
jgi:uncharacterized membrane protein YfcA